MSRSRPIISRHGICSHFSFPNLFGGVDRHVPIYAPNTTVFAAEVYGYVGLLPLTLALAGIAAWRKVGREVQFWVASRGS